MIIYLAGMASEARHMQHRTGYEHVLLSYFAHVKRNYRWLKRRKEREDASGQNKDT
jgi:hypothetical protein